MKKILTFLLAGILFLGLASAQAGYTLSDYPAPFVQDGVFNATIVVGKNAATSDVIGAVDIAASLVAESEADIALGRVDQLFDTHLGVLDVDAPELGSQPMIIVGGPCINSMAAKMMGYPQPCNEEFEIGKATIKYDPVDQALLVAGYEAQETLSASYVLADHEDYKLGGLESEVTIVGQGVLSLRTVGQ